MYIHITLDVRKRLTDKCRKLLNVKRSNYEKYVTNTTELQERERLKNKHLTIVGGTIYKMSLDSNLCFYKTYKKLEKEYNEIKGV